MQGGEVKRERDMGVSKRALVLGMAAASVMACSRQQDRPETPSEPELGFADPADVVAPLYQPYLTEGARFPAFRDQAPWSAGLWAELEAMMARSQALNEPILDFDPLIGAQDGQLSNLSVTTEAAVENSHAVVRARFTNLGATHEIVFYMIWEGGGWRVDNIAGGDWDLRQIAVQGTTPPTP